MLTCNGKERGGIEEGRVGVRLIDYFVDRRDATFEFVRELRWTNGFDLKECYFRSRLRGPEHRRVTWRHTPTVVLKVTSSGGERSII